MTIKIFEAWEMAFECLKLATTEPFDKGPTLNLLNQF